MASLYIPHVEMWRPATVPTTSAMSESTKQRGRRAARGRVQPGKLGPPRASANTDARVVILVADGVRPDTLADAIDAGELPALARLRAEGGLHTVTSVFPSVTGPAY